MIEIREYLTSDGRSPFKHWLHDLRDKQTRARVMIRINRVRLGNFGDCKALGEGLFELRAPFGPGYRIYFARKGQTVVLLLCGGDKASQRNDIERARRYWKNYRSRDNGEE
jgi:putative addiction module killer protein